jgi:hypothetical protein
MRADMGSVNPVIAPQMSGLIEGSLKDLDTRLAEAKIANARRFVRAERELKERVAKLHERLLATQKDFHLTPDHVQIAVKTGLALADRPPLEPVALADAPQGRVFRMPPFSGSWARCLEGLRHPHTQQIRPITFDHAVAKGRDDVVLVHLNHRLVQMCLRLLRAEVWAQDDVKKLHRITVRTLSDGSIDGPAVVVISRLVITGGNHHRLHEELTVSGGYLRDQSFRREDGVTRVQQWLDAAQPLRANDSLFHSLRARFDRAQSAILQAVHARSKDRLRFLATTLRAREQQEIDDIGSVLNELENAIQSELTKDQQPEQMSLFTEDERTQLKRDTASLEARLKRIPAERIEEIKSIETRYAKLDDRTFPVAVVFLVPKSAVQGGAA